MADSKQSGDCEKSPSHIFENVFSTGGTNWVTCEGCEREHFSFDRSFDMEQESVDYLTKQSQIEPDKYVEHDGYVRTVDIDGRCFVVGCQCNKLYRYEAFFKAYRDKICEFFRREAESRLEDAMHDTGTALEAMRVINQAKAIDHNF